MDIPRLSIRHRIISARIAGGATLLCGMFLIAAPVSAEIYKCTNADGKTSFSDAPCPKGQTGQVVEVKSNSIDTSEQREQSLKSENQALKEKLAAAERAGVPTAQPAAPAGPDASRIDSAACKTATRDYEIAAGSIANNKALIRARESAMYGSCGMREPDRQTTKVKVDNNGSGKPRYVVPPASGAR
jgi:hypothetical protein